MFSETQIIAKSWLVKEVCNLVLLPYQLSVDKIFLIGSYANGNATNRSDLDYLVQLKGGTRLGQYYPAWKDILAIQKQLGNRVHVIFGREEAQKSLLQKHGKKYREIPQGGIYGVTCGSSTPS